VVFAVAFIGRTEVTAPWSLTAILLVLAGLIVMHWMGLYDDFVNLPAVLKFLIQIGAGVLVAGAGVLLRVIDLPWIGEVSLPTWAAFVVTILWVVSSANAVNLIDGADGLAGGVSMIAALFMGIIALAQGNLTAAVLSFALVGALAGFLVFNLPPAKIFMGDSGSLSLGYVLAVIPLVGLQRGDPGAMPVAALPVLTLMFVPFVDTLLAIIRRVSRGLPVHSADREHIHHRLIDRGIAGRRLLAVIYGGMVVLGLTAMSWYSIQPESAAIITLAVWMTLIGTIVAMRGRDGV
jgi:UDP-GlcNAc:undecaprenyl-phosphate GlcNAc-1-phosphate transferase